MKTPRTGEKFLPLAIAILLVTASTVTRAGDHPEVRLSAFYALSDRDH
jgi:hypothetical protein